MRKQKGSAYQQKKSIESWWPLTNTKVFGLFLHKQCKLTQHLLKDRQSYHSGEGKIMSTVL